MFSILNFANTTKVEGRKKHYGKRGFLVLVHSKLGIWLYWVIFSFEMKEFLKFGHFHSFLATTSQTHLGHFNCTKQIKCLNKNGAKSKFKIHHTCLAQIHEGVTFSYSML
jgi:hypothetical protein